MANYSYTSNNINFSIPDNADYYFGKLQNEYSNFKRGAVTPLINAVEIDWNGAQVAGQTLNNVGESLSITFRQ